MTFTKEQLQKIIETDHVQCGDAAALARELLGSRAERDADKKVIVDSVVLFETLRQRIAELEEQLRREQDYHLSVDMERMELWKKLEARTVTVKPPAYVDGNTLGYGEVNHMIDLCVDAFERACHSAGINLTVEG